MKKTMLVAAASAIALASCASVREEKSEKGEYRSGRAAFDPRNPNVYVVSNGVTTCPGKKTYIVVDQEPIYFFRAANAQAFPIIWHLQTQGYSFVTNPKIGNPVAQGHSLAGEIHSCRAGGNTMQCTNNASTSGLWKYTLVIQDDNTSCGSPPPLDPQVGND